MKKTIENQWGTKITYEDSPEVHKAVFNHLIENYFKKHEQFSGEGILQDDDATIYAPDAMADIADDIIKFKFEEEDDE